MTSIGELPSIDEQFDCVTLIEVIERLRPDEIWVMLFSWDRSAPQASGGKLVLTTPNYMRARGPPSRSCSIACPT